MVAIIVRHCRSPYAIGAATASISQIIQESKMYFGSDVPARLSLGCMYRHQLPHHPPVNPAKLNHGRNVGVAMIAMNGKATMVPANADRLL